MRSALPPVSPFLGVCTVSVPSIRTRQWSGQYEWGLVLRAAGKGRCEKDVVALTGLAVARGHDRPRVCRRPSPRGQIERTRTRGMLDVRYTCAMRAGR